MTMLQFTKHSSSSTVQQQQISYLFNRFKFQTPELFNVSMILVSFSDPNKAII